MRSGATQMNSADGFEISAADAESLLEYARAALAEAVHRGRRLEIDIHEFGVALREYRASFVTLTRRSHLRGCIGSLEARRPLVQDVVENAWAAALRDPRFKPVHSAELAEIDIALSVLGEPERVDAADEQALIDLLLPGEHGLILQDAKRRATFLPSVWEQLPDPRDFVSQLKRKAGWSERYWSDSMGAWVYRVTHIG